MSPESAPIFSFRDADDREAFIAWRKASGLRKLVFTNGVFDILHAGHVSYIHDARKLGDGLVLGLNSDASVRSIKGPKRPLMHEQDRATVLAALRTVDAVLIFDDDTPLELVRFVQPDVMVKGGDYTRETIVGADVVEARGGRVITIPLLEGRSTTGVVERILERYQKNNE
ncbi:MAG: D-glycero-beta-D-manno-heptose 1-phosphate adenylyltransferase [Bacteroidota bacterium]|nr:D-glycero-beta-D-manno-heptose 1-phosphate adenylyltransferase [Bacteroidota bacterium]MDP4232568.1 D-glycero-beta-D-manno-heptose 1-phosphate adenylyltransferase [Bacteroidota bacterium]MDP4242978.1 D-glycero-beta-D-manno-heptose 1-phosphate adenylyltransferase [Bacteroidota bacterium]MDP4286447.1 D-glycero-beta-D-manno-heptose 1-phosphate adenylyltransferase [Bacteroidota bacterium]